MNKVLICLGMHRSGTSLIANWLHDCGLNMGDRLIEGNVFNKNGHFEDKDFLELHEDVLDFHNLASGGLKPPVNISLNNYYLKKFEYLIKFKNALHEQWGWKEPRTCLFTDIYRQLLPDARYIIVFRDYPYVVDSLFRRRTTYLNDWYYAQGRYGKFKLRKLYQQKKEELKEKMNTDLDAWCMFNQRLLDLASAIPASGYFFADYQDLKISEAALYNTLTANWEFDLNFKSFSSIFDPSLMNESRPQLQFNAELVQKAEEIKNKMLKLKSSGKNN